LKNRNSIQKGVFSLGGSTLDGWYLSIFALQAYFLFVFYFNAGVQGVW
jgi:hypothetical protein